MKARKLKQVDHVTIGKIDALIYSYIMNDLLYTNDYFFLSFLLYYSEPERLSHYRNSVAYLDEEVEALLAKRKHSSTVM